MSGPNRGEVWWAETPGKRRPVLVLTRDAAIPVLRTLVVAPVTRHIRGIPSEVRLDADDGMPVECVASFDNVTVTDKALLTERVTALSAVRMSEVCRAVNIALGC